MPSVLQGSLDTYFGSGLLNGSANMFAGVTWSFVGQRSKVSFLEVDKRQLGAEELGWAEGEVGARGRAYLPRGEGHPRNFWPWAHEVKNG